LVDEALAGEEIVITRRGVTVAKLISSAPVHRRRFGALAGAVSIDESFFEPLPPEDLERWGL